MQEVVDFEHISIENLLTLKSVRRLVEVVDIYPMWTIKEMVDYLYKPGVPGLTIDDVRIILTRLRISTQSQRVMNMSSVKEQLRNAQIVSVPRVVRKDPEVVRPVPVPQPVQSGHLLQRQIEIKQKETGNLIKQTDDVKPPVILSDNTSSNTPAIASVVDSGIVQLRQIFKKHDKTVQNTVQITLLERLAHLFRFMKPLRITVSSPYFLGAFFLIVGIIYWLVARDLFQSSRPPFVTDVSLPISVENNVNIPVGQGAGSMGNTNRVR